MKKFTILAGLMIGISCAAADLTDKSGKTYQDYEVVSVNDKGVGIIFESGSATIPLLNWPENKKSEIAELLQEYRKKEAKKPSRRPKLTEKEVIKYLKPLPANYTTEGQRTFFGIQLKTLVTEVDGVVYEKAFIYDSPQKFRGFSVLWNPPLEHQLPLLAPSCPWRYSLTVNDTGQILDIDASATLLSPDGCLNFWYLLQSLEKQHRRRFIDMPLSGNPNPASNVNHMGPDGLNDVIKEWSYLQKQRLHFGSIIHLDEKNAIRFSIIVYPKAYCVNICWSAGDYKDFILQQKRPPISEHQPSLPAKMRQKLRKVTMPKVSIQNMTPQAALEYLASLVKQADPEGSGIEFEISFESDAAPINMIVSNKSGEDILDLICLATKWTYEARGERIVILETR